MSSDDEDRQRRHLKDIQEARRMAAEGRQIIRRELSQGSVSATTKADYAARLGDYQDMLRPYRDEAALQSEWFDRLPVPDLMRLLSTTVSREQVVNAATGRTEVVTHPKAATLRAETLIAHGQELDSIFKELGFAASAESEVRVWGYEEPDDDSGDAAEQSQAEVTADG